MVDAAGAAMAPPAGAEPDAGAIPESAFLLFFDFLPVPVSAAIELAPAEEPAAGAIASALAPFFLDLDEVVPDDDAAELSELAASLFLDFLDFFVVVDVVLWSPVLAAWACAQTVVAISARNRHNDTPQWIRVVVFFKGLS